MVCDTLVDKDIFTKYETTVREACKPKDYDIQKLKEDHCIDYSEVEIDIKCISVEDIEIDIPPYNHNYNPKSVDGIIISNTNYNLDMFEAKEISDSLSRKRISDNDYHMKRVRDIKVILKYIDGYRWI